ncbi:hypothetical protein P872_10155 [Rhodonellum psychrophilum GCM71 = DSM 17998]|uniref:Schlafen AlbA-2 domain-containing protein n=2 Tax=Rhodonellum TaxID=336827 RepID=U5BXG3_9BACT|nr:MULTISPECIES: ATP-binding protein [Rhodonellum]ERM81306.1 hypothetical protein P872_10155 [Rhodonellum psychrophilum GCM71 = DSM 17998]MDO9554083.1 ATP-binding protein [Rhodonellum sp.]SDZ54690.1 Putative DNA-binding domain-containing protein [Rhodonellum ikkaensis]
MIIPKKDNEFIKQILKQSESEILDFKQNISSLSKIAKTLVSFANTQGGQIIVGISDKKRITKIDAEEEIYMIEKSSLEYCHPPVLFGIEVYEGNFGGENNTPEEFDVLVVNVPKSNQKHFAKDASGKLTAYQRIRDQNIPKRS